MDHKYTVVLKVDLYPGNGGELLEWAESSDTYTIKNSEERLAQFCAMIMALRQMAGKLEGQVKEQGIEVSLVPVAA